MRRMLGTLLAPLAIVLIAPGPAAAAQPPRYANQGTVTAGDIQRLQDRVYDAGADISRLRGRDASAADDLQKRLDDLRDEVTYLRVKLRKEGSVSTAEYDDVRQRIDELRSEARGEPAGAPAPPPGGWVTNSNPGASPPPPPPGQPGGYYGGTQDQRRMSVPRPGEVPAGQEIDVRLETELSSATAQVEDRFRATTVVDLYQGNDVLIPAGSTLRGVVSSVDKATRTDRKGSLTLAFDEITIRGRRFPIHGTVEEALESEGVRGEAGKIGAGAGVGAILGGILGGAKGALLGILIGGGGTMAATPGKDVTVPAGTVLRVRLEDPIMVR